jgi:hypothetical protein
MDHCIEDINDTYLHLVTSLLMEKDNHFRANRSDSMTSEDRDDFLPLVSEFLNPPSCNLRNRAFSWDVGFEEGISEETSNNLVGGILSPKKHVIIENDNSQVTSMPMKKRKVSILESNSKKSLSPTQSASKASFSTSSDVSNGIKTVVGFKKEESTTSKSNNSLATAKNPINIQLPSVSVVSDIKQKSIITPLLTSTTFEQPLQFVHGRPTFLVNNKNQDAKTANSSSSLIGSGTSTANSVGSGLMKSVSNIHKIPLLASDFGPKNGVANGDGCRVGVYTREERLVRIERFREKKQKRIWRKQIKYDCRKRLADTRPRVKGRFVSRIEDTVEVFPVETGCEDDSKVAKKQKISPTFGVPTPGIAVDFDSYALSSGPGNGGETSQESESEGDEDHHYSNHLQDQINFEDMVNDIIFEIKKEDSVK